jgi:hypothetical protein
MKSGFVDANAPYDSWIALRYEWEKCYERDGIPYEKYAYAGRTTPCTSILAALELASSLYTKDHKPLGKEAWIEDPLPTPFEVRGYGDGDEWVLFTMYPQINSRKELHGWITSYHPYRYNTLEDECIEMGVELPPTYKSLMDGESMEDLTRSVELPCDKEFDDLLTPEACEDHAVAMINKHGDKLPHYSFN